MPDDVPHASGPPERRSRTEAKEQIEDLRREMLAAIQAGDDATAKNLHARMDALEKTATDNQAVLLARLGLQDKTLERIDSKIGAHDEFVRIKQEEDAVQQHQKAEQEMRERLMAEFAAKDDAKRKERHERWNRVIPYGYGLLTGSGSWSVIYFLTNSDHLRWGAQTDTAILVLVVVLIGLMVLYRIGP